MMWLVLTLLLCLMSPSCLVLSLGYGEVEAGCEDWKLVPSSPSSVCCKRCKAGNRLVSECGADVKALCVPCGNGTYILSHNTFCSRCTPCTNPLRVKTACTPARDTVCECVEGFQCGDPLCTFCIQQCGKGEEPTGQRGCRRCPAGTFNNQIHHQCVNWSSSCPLPDQQIMAAGTAESDIVCAAKFKMAKSGHTEIPPNPNSNDSSSERTLIFGLICTCLIISTAMMLCVTMYYKKEKTPQKMPPGLVEPPTGRRSLVPEPEQCSFCFPQEERGSLSSVLLDNKPFELVV